MMAVVRRTSAVLLPIALAVALAACAATGPSSDGAPTVSPANGPDPATIRYTCVGPPGFLPTLFDRPGSAELEDHPSAAALRAFVVEGSFGLGFLPDAGWWLVHRDKRQAEYIARLPAGFESPFGQVTMQAKGALWAFAAGGDCQPAVLLVDMVPATWTLSSNGPAPGRSTVGFTALVTDRGCTGGEPVGLRLLPPTITYTDDAVFVVFSARPARGLTTCQGKPPTEVVVRLREPLGDRRLLDGGVFPPADPVAPAF